MDLTLIQLEIKSLLREFDFSSAVLYRQVSSVTLDFLLALD
jgi:hypothetical protein